MEDTNTIIYSSSVSDLRQRQLKFITIIISLPIISTFTYYDNLGKSLSFSDLQFPHSSIDNSILHGHSENGKDNLDNGF